MKKIAFIRTGGQTGVDRAALDISRKYNIPIVGWCPKNGWAEDMPNPPGIIKYYPELKETSSEDVSQRTIWNVRDSDATLIINPKKSSFSNGTSLTEQAAKDFNRPYIEIKSSKESSRVISWLQTLGNGITLNIGGPRQSECPSAYEKTTIILDTVINHFFNNSVK